MRVGQEIDQYLLDAPPVHLNCAEGRWKAHIHHLAFAIHQRAQCLYDAMDEQAKVGRLLGKGDTPGLKTGALDQVGNKNFQAAQVMCNRMHQFAAGIRELIAQCIQ